MRELLLTDSINSFESIMEGTWLKEQLKLIKAGHGGGVAFGRELESKNTVPLSAYYWYKAREEIAYGDITGVDKPGNNALITAVMGADLRTLEHAAGFSLLMQGLKSNDHPIAVQGQLCIASGYARENYKIAFKNDFSIAVHNQQQNIFYVKHENDLEDNGILSLQENSVVYCFIGNLEQDANRLLLNWSPPRPLLEAALKNIVCIVICGIWIETVNNNPVLVRKGRLLEGFDTGNKNSGFVYIPNEKICLHAADTAPALG